MATNEIAELTEELRKVVESKNADSADNKQKLANLEEGLAKAEKENQELVLKQVEADKKAIELAEKQDKEFIDLSKKFGDLEKQAYRPAANASDEAKAVERKAFNKALRFDQDELSAEEYKYLRTDSNVEGGFLCPPEYDADMIKLVTDISPIRDLARVTTTSRKSVQIPIRKSLPSGGYEGEAEEDGKSNSNYDMVTLTPYRLSNTVEYTRNILLDSVFNIESELQADQAESFAQIEGNAFVNGTGVKQPLGFLKRTTDGGKLATTLLTAALTGNDLIKVTAQVKTTYYNPIFMFNQQTLVDIRTLKDSEDRYLFEYGNLAAGMPATIAGYKYVIIPDMPNLTAATAVPVVFGDMARGYRIVDLEGLFVIRDPYAQKRKGIVEITFTKFNTGQQVNSEALHGILTPTP